MQFGNREGCIFVFLFLVYVLNKMQNHVNKLIVFHVL